MHRRSPGTDSKDSKSSKQRPRTFDKTKALDGALKLFWRHGYEGTSLAALTGDVGMHDPSTVIRGADGKFYVYATGGGLPMSISND